jgi:3-methylfumaryl-CoA hydratase
LDATMRDGFMDDGTALENLRDWIGRSESHRDVIDAAPLARLGALLDHEEPAPRDGEAAPPLAHWLYFLPTYRQSRAGEDGHAARGEFLPPVPLPRRMWAGSRLEFVRPLRVGSDVTRLSRITDVALKAGRSGPLAFVTVRHELSDRHGVVLTDEHDIVYRGTAPLAPPPSMEPGRMSDVPWRREVRPDPLLLFRYSAVTFNGHRIHYDHPYATGVEGYPGLVVHGPLIATLLVDLLRRERPGVVLRSFSFRALRPLFDTGAFHLCGAPDDTRRSARLWTRDGEGAVTMEAQAAW